MKSEGKHPHLLQRELILLHDRSKSSQQITAKVHSKIQRKFTVNYSKSSQQNTAKIHNKGSLSDKII